MIYPIEYRMIPTQYAFLVSEKDGRYRVQVRAVTNLKEQTFDSEAEAMEFISKKEVL